MIIEENKKCITWSDKKPYGSKRTYLIFTNSINCMPIYFGIELEYEYFTETGRNESNWNRIYN